MELHADCVFSHCVFSHGYYSIQTNLNCILELLYSLIVYICYSIWGNQIPSVPDDALAAFPLLTNLYISSNLLSEVPNVSGLLMLETLSLHHNHITHVLRCSHFIVYNINSYNVLKYIYLIWFDP